MWKLQLFETFKEIELDLLRLVLREAPLKKSQALFGHCPRTSPGR